MKYSDLLKNLKFANNLVEIFKQYGKKLDEYFKNDDNKEKHQELYNYYLELMNNIQKEAKGIIKKWLLSFTY